MASFWDKVKALFGVQGGDAPPPSTALGSVEQRVEDILVRRTVRKEPFEAFDIAAESTAELPDRKISDLASASALVEQAHKDGRFARLGYTRTARGDGNWLYHPKGYDPATYKRAPVKAPSAAVPGSTGASTRAAGAAPLAAAVTRLAAKSIPKNPFAAPDLLGLSADALRLRALQINPFRTPWIGRVDTIPSQSDERTAIIDRGLILRGLLTEPQITEIHRIGDLWLKHHDAVSLAGAAAAKTAERAMEALAEERAEKKAQKKREAAERAARRAKDVLRRKREDIIYLGRGVSSQLSDRRSHIEALAQRGLPVLSTPADVARAMGISVSELRFLCFHSEAAEKPHYVYFEVPKRSGGKRLLSAPQPKLAQAQEWVLREVLEKLPTEPPAHGFVKARSTVTCAAPHIGRDIVVNLDLSDFFPTIAFHRVRGVFRRLGYSPAVATILALLCTEPPRQAVTFDEKRYHVAVGPRALPQGACTSPALSNQVTRKLDRRLTGMCRKHGWAYTRYADDLTFSAAEGQRAEVGILLARVRHILGEEGFVLNPKKGRVQRAGGRQTVTGIVVNDKLSVPREEVRRLRALLHQAKKTGLAAQNRDNLPHFEAHVRGRLAYLHMIDPARAKPLLDALAALGTG